MSFANRGKAFEKLVEFTNQQYKLKGWGLIDQVPTPTKNIRGKIIYEKKSTVDFYGIAHGRAIAFDAKSTKETTRFPLDNVKPHQVGYLKKFQEQGGVSFFLVHFEKLKETYYMDLDTFLRYWKESESGGKKSIPHQAFVLWGQLVKSEKGVALHYLKYCS